jgi:SnoaL-like protein
MSTAAAVLNTAALEHQLNQSLLAGQVMEAFEELYAGDVVMQENLAPPTAGKAANRERELAFFGQVEQVHGVSLLGSAVNGDRSYSEWEYDITFKGGVRVKWAQATVRQWKDGKVAHERFYYHKG